LLDLVYPEGGTFSTFWLHNAIHDINIHKTGIVTVLTRLLFISLIFLSPATKATLISFAGYSHDTHTDYVTGGGLVWKQWDETVNLSIDQALSTYGSQWRLATGIEMGNLFNDFFGLQYRPSKWGADSAIIEYPHNDGDSGSPTHEFVRIFGDTYKSIGGNWPADISGDEFEISTAYFDPGRLIQAQNLANVADDYTYRFSPSVTTPINGWAQLTTVTSTIYDSHPHRGIALVQKISNVPLPSSLQLFVVAIMSLAFQVRKSKGTHTN
jgi:hypothetical protein